MLNLKLVTDGKRFAVRKGIWPLYSYVCLFGYPDWFPFSSSGDICWGPKEIAIKKYEEMKQYKIKVIRIEK